jgi:hypothetical protein
MEPESAFHSAGPPQADVENAGWLIACSMVFAAMLCNSALICDVSSSWLTDWLLSVSSSDINESASLLELPLVPKNDSSSLCEMLESPSVSIAEMMSEAASEARSPPGGGGGGADEELLSELAKVDNSSELMLPSLSVSILSNSDCNALLDDVEEVESTAEVDDESLLVLELVLELETCCSCIRIDMISWLSELPELELLELEESPEDDDDASLGGGGGGMNWVLELDEVELDELASDVLELALDDELLLACSICMRIERLDPPTPLTDMSNSREESTGRIALMLSAASRRAGRCCIRELNGRAPPIRRTSSIGKIFRAM